MRWHVNWYSGFSDLAELCQTVLTHRSRPNTAQETAGCAVCVSGDWPASGQTSTQEQEMCLSEAQEPTRAMHLSDLCVIRGIRYW